MITIKHVTRLAMVSLAVAWSFDFLFWKKSPGISFFIFVLICLLGGGLITWWEDLRPARRSLWLLLPVLFFSAITFIRLEPFTKGVSFLLVLICLALLALTWRGGKWLAYSLSDYVVGFIQLAGSSLARPVILFFIRPHGKPAPGVPVSTSQPASDPEQAGIKAETQLVQTSDAAAGPLLAPQGGELRQGWSRRALSVLRGLLLAFPVIAVLAALLASADPIFSNNLASFLRLFRIENLGEYIFRAIYISIGAYLLVGVYLHAMGPSRDEKLIGLEKPWLSPFLGWTEAVIVLGAVDLLFAFFVAIQFRYFFGGQANITTSGYTFADYARRGFNELVAVAVISLLIFLALSSITRREGTAQRRAFTVLGVGLVVLVGVILVSAFQRLLLYETAYGFTRIRAYTHVFMVWVGVLLAITLALDLVGRLRGFALAVAMVSLGFGVSLGLLNVDAFIARQNIDRAQRGMEFDPSYLSSLTDDAVPEMMQAFTNPRIAARVRDQLGGVLACRASDAHSYPGDLSWQAFVVSAANARALLNLHQPELSAYLVKLGDGTLEVKVAGKFQPCYSMRPLD